MCDFVHFTSHAPEQENVMSLYVTDFVIHC